MAVLVEPALQLSLDGGIHGEECHELVHRLTCRVVAGEDKDERVSCDLGV